MPRRMITLQERLGGGNFGDVYWGLYNRILQVAVKTLKVRLLYCTAHALYGLRAADSQAPCSVVL